MRCDSNPLCGSDHLVAYYQLDVGATAWKDSGNLFYTRLPHSGPFVHITPLVAARSPPPATLHSPSTGTPSIVSRPPFSSIVHISLPALVASVLSELFLKVYFPARKRMYRQWCTQTLVRTTWAGWIGSVADFYWTLWLRTDGMIWRDGTTYYVIGRLL